MYVHFIRVQFQTHVWLSNKYWLSMLVPAGKIWHIKKKKLSAKLIPLFATNQGFWTFNIHFLTFIQECTVSNFFFYLFYLKKIKIIMHHLVKLTDAIWLLELTISSPLIHALGDPNQAPHRNSNPCPQIERQMTYQLSCPFPFQTWGVILKIIFVHAGKIWHIFKDLFSNIFTSIFATKAGIFNI